MGWEYYIAKSDLWYKIYREKEEWWTKKRERLQIDTYTLNKGFAKTFYHLSNAISALVLARIKWRKEIMPTISTKKSESEGHKEKTSWSEL